MKPKFKDGDYDGGFMDGVFSLIQAAKGEFKADGVVTGGKHKWKLFLVFVGLCGIVAFILGRNHPLLGIAAGFIGAPVSVIGIGVTDHRAIGFATVFGGFAAILIAGVAWSLFGKGKGFSGSGAVVVNRSDFRNSDSSSDSSGGDNFSGGGGESGGGGASGDY
jgi:uncharacterized protein